MPDYKNGLIYTIRSQHTDNIYIGSTCQPLYKRFFEHRRKYTRYKKGVPIYISSYKILEFGDGYIELLESYPCNSRMELHKREGELIRQYKDVCVNMCVAGRTIKQYKMENKEQIKEKGKQYRMENKEKIKKYREKNKERLTEKHNCDCGGHYMLKHKATHEKTKKHLNFIKQ